MRPLALVIPYYDNPSMLALQYRVWSEYPEALKQQLDIVLVDDGSPTAPAVDVPRPDELPRLQILRHLVDKPWHQHAARNTGANFARNEWLLLTDMDHVLTGEDLGHALGLITSVKPGRSVFTLNRREPGGELTRNERGEPKRHPNSFLVPRSLYWEIGGYDEALCGIYGTDSDFRHRAFSVGHEVFLENVYLTRYSRLIVSDASTRTLQRKEGRRGGEKQAALVAKKKRGVTGPEVLTMAWEVAL